MHFHHKSNKTNLKKGKKSLCLTHWGHHVCLLSVSDRLPGPRCTSSSTTTKFHDNRRKEKKIRTHSARHSGCVSIVLCLFLPLRIMEPVSPGSCCSPSGSCWAGCLASSWYSTGRLLPASQLPATLLAPLEQLPPIPAVLEPPCFWYFSSSLLACQLKRANAGCPSSIRRKRWLEKCQLTASFGHAGPEPSDKLVS